MRLHDESLDQDLHRDIDFPVFQGATDAVAPALDVSVEPVNASVDGQGGTIRDKPVFTIEQVIEQLNRGGAGWTPGDVEHAVPRDGDVSVLNFGFHTAESMLGGEVPTGLNLALNPPSVILMAGLQGSGKTTTTGKLALRLSKSERKKVLVASLDTRRPAAMEQLAMLAKQVEVESLPIVAGQSAADIAKRAMTRPMCAG